MRPSLEPVTDAARSASTLARAGLVRPWPPRPALLRLAAKTPFRERTLGSAVELHAATRPHETALVDARGPLAWASLDALVSRLANVFLDRVGERGRIGFMLRNGREGISCYAACGRAGVAAVPINTWSGTDDLAHIVESQELQLLIADAEFAEVVTAAASRCEVLWVHGPVAEDMPAGERYDAVLAAASAEPPGVRGGGQIVTHTSGTTGKPKGAEREVGGESVRALVRFLEKVPLHRTDRFLIAPPLFHSFAQGMASVGLVLGTTLVLPPRFDPAGVARLLGDRLADDTEVGPAMPPVDEPVTAACLVPVMLRRLLGVDATQPAERSLRAIVLSGEPLPDALRDRAEERYGEVLYDLYGSTEAGWATIATPEDQRRKPGSVGSPGRGMAVLIVDEDGNVLPPGEVGRVFVATGFEFDGYTGIDSDRGELEDIAGLERAVEFGDLGYLDEDGYLYVTGRADDMIVSGGENVYPSEVEAVLEAHEDLTEAAVIGVADDDFGEVLHAYVAARDGAVVDADELREFVGSRVARYKAPKVVHVVDALPRNATGKVLKGELGAEQRS